MKQQAEQEAAEVKKQNPEEHDIQAVVRPSQDVFTAIFCSDAPVSQVLAESISNRAAVAETIDVDALPIKRERGAGSSVADDILAGVFGERDRGVDGILADVFGGTKKSKTLDLLDVMGEEPNQPGGGSGKKRTNEVQQHQDQAELTKKSKTLELLGKTSAVKSFVSDAIGGKEKKKKKKEDKKKKKKKKKEKKDDKYIYI